MKLCPLTNMRPVSRDFRSDSAGVWTKRGGFVILPSMGDRSNAQPPAGFPWG